jgi:hypothetical protein
MSGNAVRVLLPGFCAHIIQRSHKDQINTSMGEIYIFFLNGWRDRRGFWLWFNRIDVGVCTTLAIATTKRERESPARRPKSTRRKATPNCLLKV